MNAVSDAWSRNKNTGGLLSNDMEASYKTLFLLNGGMEVPEMYCAIDNVMKRINTYECDYEADEQEAKTLCCEVANLDPCRPNRKRLELVESYKLKVNLDRAIGWMLTKISDSNLAPISIMPK